LISLAGNLGLLFFFKYTDWILDSIQMVGAWFGFDPGLHDLKYAILPEGFFDSGTTSIAVPVGISFYTFQTLSYTIDIYRRNIQPARNLREFALFVAFFPQLVAGPIVRAIDFLPQLEKRPTLSRTDFHEGLYRFTTGLLKKVVLADVIGRYLVDPVFATPGDYPPLGHALALYGFAFQIYYDFSGYSDCAIGVARMLGFRLPENFNGPYRSRSVREFWRRWHISLSSWVRDYVFFPLAGFRRPSELKVARNVMITMVIIGVWHGASILWVIYGAMNGAMMCVERWLDFARGGRRFTTTRTKSAIAWFLTFNYIVLTVVFVRAPTLGVVADMFTQFGTGGGFHVFGYAALALGAAVHFLPKPVYPRFERALVSLPTPVCGVLLGLAAGLVAILVVGETPFIYFQF
jgi:D-alanyl-lipoteichoic acid acyltransferase DltB (MBOAT superfamily)